MTYSSARRLALALRFFMPLLLVAAAFAVFALVAIGAAPPAAALDRVTFATNWRAEAERGGFYQAVADGTYAKYGLDVTILQGARKATIVCCWRLDGSTSTWAPI